MKFVLQFFFLLCVFSCHSEGKAYTLPYDRNGGECRNTSSEYSPRESICCSKCRPGFRLLTECTPSSDTVCEKCREGTYSDAMNYHHNCFSCRVCNPSKHQEYTKRCTSESNSQCECKTGWYCPYRVGDEPCNQCRKRPTCPPGKGVKTSGSTRCFDCVEGTFSNETSSNACQPHTRCEAEGMDVLHRGNATHDTVCKPLIIHNKVTTRAPPTTTVQTTTLCDTEPPPAAPVVSTEQFITRKDEKSTSLPSNDTLFYGVIGVIGGVVVILLVVLLTCLVIRHRKGLGKPPVKEVTQPGQASDRKMESEFLLADGKTPTSSSASSASSTPDSHSQSTGDSQDNIHAEQPSVSSPCVNFSFTATINCQLNQPQGSCCIPICSPTQPHPQPQLPTQPPPYPQPQPEPETETQPPSVQPDLPLSQEEQLRVPCEEENSKDALQSVQESGMTVC